jgi:hypothetical protein
MFVAKHGGRSALGGRHASNNTCLFIFEWLYLGIGVGLACTPARQGGVFTTQTKSFCATVILGSLPRQVAGDRQWFGALPWKPSQAGDWLWFGAHFRFGVVSWLADCMLSGWCRASVCGTKQLSNDL